MTSRTLLPNWLISSFASESTLPTIIVDIRFCTAFDEFTNELLSTKFDTAPIFYGYIC